MTLLQGPSGDCGKGSGMKAEELKTKTPDQLRDGLVQAQEGSLLNLRFQQATNQLENTARMRRPSRRRPAQDRSRPKSRRSSLFILNADAETDPDGHTVTWTRTSRRSPFPSNAASSTRCCRRPCGSRRNTALTMRRTSSASATPVCALKNARRFRNQTLDGCGRGVSQNPSRPAERNPGAETSPRRSGEDQ